MPGTPHVGRNSGIEANLKHIVVISGEGKLALVSGLPVDKVLPLGVSDINKDPKIKIVRLAIPAYSHTTTHCRSQVKFLKTNTDQFAGLNFFPSRLDPCAGPES